MALTAELAASGDTVTVTGTSSLPDGAQLMWELVGLDTTAEQRELLYASGRLEGSTQVDGGTYSATVRGDSWDTLGLCDALGLELWVSYYPYAELAASGVFPEQPDELYALYGDAGELIPGAVPPAELVELSTPAGAQRVELVVTCP